MERSGKRILFLIWSTYHAQLDCFLAVSARHLGNKSGAGTSKLGASPGFVPALQTAFFRVFILSCFRDPLCDFAVREMKMKTDHENTNVRKHEKKKGELNRTRANSGELFYDGNTGNGRQKPMNYGKRSKSRELARTLTPKTSARHGSRMEEKNFEQKLRKVTKGRRWQFAGSLFSMPFVHC